MLQNSMGKSGPFAANGPAVSRPLGSHTNDPQAKSTLFDIPPPHKTPRRRRERSASGVEHLARIEQVLGIEGGFDAAHQVDRGEPVLLLHIFPLLLADPVLARAGAAHADGPMR